jgi:hypothetical protein
MIDLKDYENIEDTGYSVVQLTKEDRKVEFTVCDDYMNVCTVMTVFWDGKIRLTYGEGLGSISINSLSRFNAALAFLYEEAKRLMPDKADWM